MSAITNMISLVRILANGRAVSVGNEVQLTDVNGDPVGTAGSPLVVSGGGPGGSSQVEIVNATGDPMGTESFPLFVTSQILSVAASPTLSTSPDYAAGDMVGATVTSFGNVPNSAGGSIVLETIKVNDNAGQAPALILFFASADLNGAGGTYTDNSPVVWGTGDKAKIDAIVTVAAANYKTVAGLSVQTLSNVGMTLTPSVTTLYMLVVADGAYNAAASTDLRITLCFRRVTD